MNIVSFLGENQFLLRALVACIGISFICPILGVFLMMRKMSLMGDAIGHSILPGVAIGYLISGTSLLAMTIGGLVAGVLVIFFAGVVSEKTNMAEDASLAAFYLISLALGVIIISYSGTNLDLFHILFGSILAVSSDGLILLAVVVSISLIVVALILRVLVVEVFDNSFLRHFKVNITWYHLLFLFIVVFNLVVDFQILGTILVVGLMMLPATSAKLLAKSFNWILLLAILISIIASVIGVYLSYTYDLAAGPAIILSAGAIYILSLVYHKLKQVIIKPHYKD